MKINCKVLVKLILGVVFIAFYSCGINLTANNSFGSTEAHLIIAQKNDNNGDNDEDDDDDDDEREAENDIIDVCGDDAANCLYRRIVKPTGGCAVTESCIPPPIFLIHITLSNYTKYTFFTPDGQDILKTVTVDNNSKPTNIKNVLAEQIKGLKVGQVYDIKIETKTADGNIKTQLLDNIKILKK